MDSPCPAGLKCTNTEGSFECSCYNGFKRIDGKCENIDECLPSNWRPGTETCLPHCGENLGSCPEHCEGGYCCRKGDTSCPRAARDALTVAFSQCAVPVNFVDPCLSKPHSTCHDTHGSYECRCDSGYISDYWDTICWDINECEDQQNLHSCPENSLCTNKPG